MKIKGILSCLSNAYNQKKNQLKINKNCGEGAPFESNHMMDSHHMALFSTAHPKEKGCRYKYPGGSKLTGAAAWGRASPNHPTISCFSFLQSFFQRHGSALHALSHLKTSGEGNGQVAGQRNTPILAWEKRKQTQHTQDWHWVPWPGRNLHSPSSGLDPASLQVSL